jgi:hypothetical protein
MSGLVDHPSMRHRLAHLCHLARRFAGSLSPRPPSPTDETWARGWLAPGEQVLWARLSNPDRRHAIGVARRVVAVTGPGVERWVVAAALLHDVGKLDSGLGTGARVVATVWAGVRGRSTAAAGDGRIARYLRHDVLGAGLLADAGADPRTVAWAADHHRARGAWRVPPELGDVLAAADDD